MIRDRGLLWMDGRYFVQVESQQDADVFTLMRTHEEKTLEEWAFAHLPGYYVIGIDSCTESIAGI